MPVTKPQTPVVVKNDTAEITAKPTSPTLVEFQTKNAALPEWRLQLQNSVRKRRENLAPTSTTTTAHETASQPAVHRILPTNGSAALKAEIVEQSAPVAVKGNEKLAGALRRIEESRRKFLLEECEANLPKVETSQPAPGKQYPFYIASKNAEILPKPVEHKTAVNFAPVPKIENLPIIEKKEFDTSKLKPLPNSTIISANLNKVSTGESPDPADKEAPIITISRVRSEADEDFQAPDMQIESETGEEEIEDFAPLSMRFNAAVFDLIIGAFAGLILLSPLMISGGNWFSLAGFMAFFVTCSIVMFIYLTTSVGFFGQTLGMKIFSLEILDIEEEEYPSLHQAAVNTSVYLASLALGGIGFIPALFNDEKRAAHDLLSGTIVVREEY